METMIKTIQAELAAGVTVPYLGLGIFEGVVTETGEAMPHDSDAMILAMNGGRAMPPRLMFEYSRAAMHLEQRKGRQFMEQMMNHIYTKPFAPLEAQKKVLAYSPPYIVDTNRDDKIQSLLADTRHTMILGKSRIMANLNRYEVYEWDVTNQKYFEVEESCLDEAPLILLKPMGSPTPEPTFVISDADYVDWLTEAMGGFAFPSMLKTYRKGKKYLFLGVSLNRDTERMVANEITLDLEGGYVVGTEPLSKKAEKFMQKHDLVYINTALPDFLKQL
jgi:hypothetical protein